MAEVHVIIPPPKVLSFDTYRFQLLPIDKIQLKINEPIMQNSEIISRKNEFFENVLNTISENHELSYPQSKVLIRQEFKDGSIFAYKMAIRKHLRRGKEDFTEEKIDDFPYIWIIFDNDPSVQKILIQKNFKAFLNTKTASRIIESNLGNLLQKYHLAIYVNPIYLITEFWDVVGKHSEDISKLTFNLIRPNMSNISSSISEDLKDMQKETDAHETKLELNSYKDSALKITKKNKYINDLVDYAMKGGGRSPITLKIKSLNKKIVAAKHLKEVSLKDVEINGPVQDAIKTLRQLLKDD